MSDFSIRIYEGFGAVDRLTTKEFESVVKQAGLSCLVSEDAYIVWEAGKCDAWVIQILKPGPLISGNYTCYCSDCFEFRGRDVRYGSNWIRSDNLKTSQLKNLGVSTLAVGEEYAGTRHAQSSAIRYMKDLHSQLEKEGFKIHPLVALSDSYTYKINSPVYDKYKKHREMSGYDQEPCVYRNEELVKKVSTL
jgi:hypothetical protein